MAKKTILNAIIPSMVVISSTVGIFLLFNSSSQKNDISVQEVSVQEVEHVFRTCPLPFSDWEVPEKISSVCSDPALKKQDFTVVPTSLYIVKNGRKLRLVDIKPSLPTALSYLPESESKTICTAFKEIAEEIRKKGGFAVVKCNRNLPVLRVGIPNLPKKPEKSESEGAGSFREEKWPK